MTTTLYKSYPWKVVEYAGPVEWQETHGHRRGLIISTEAGQGVELNPSEVLALMVVLQLYVLKATGQRLRLADMPIFDLLDPNHE